MNDPRCHRCHVMCPMIRPKNTVPPYWSHSICVCMCKRHVPRTHPRHEIERKKKMLTSKRIGWIGNKLVFSFTPRLSPSISIHSLTVSVLFASTPIPIRNIVEDHHRSLGCIEFQQRLAFGCCTYNSSPQQEDLHAKVATAQRQRKNEKKIRN